MRSTRSNLWVNLCMVACLSIGFWACIIPSNEGGDEGSGGTSAGGSGGGSGGASGTGGSKATGGTSASGGTSETGGTTSSGGSQTGGTTVKGAGGRNVGGRTGAGGEKGTGGVTETGGETGAGGTTVEPGTGGSAGRSGIGGRTGQIGGRTGTDTSPGTGGGPGSGGSTGGGGCEKGQVKGNEVVIMGESFYAMSPQYIQKRIESNAKKAGALGSSESYRNVAVSGQPMSYIASTEWTNATKGNAAVKVIIMDGGGIDCMSSSCSSCPDTFKTLLGKMADYGVQDVIYTRYPEPGNPPGSNATLKKNLDTLMPKMEEVCKSTTKPVCHWVDLRPVWVNGDTSDGLHPTQSGGDHCGDAIWEKMVEECIAQ